MRLVVSDVAEHQHRHDRRNGIELCGRATHIHVDIFRGSALVKTTQIAFPEDVTRAVYATGVYASKGQNSTTNSSDNVFSDGTQNELAALSGNTTSGYTATLTIGISA